MITIGLGTAVFCESKQCGLVHQLIIQPHPFYVSHLVVKPASQIDRLIPISHITKISDDAVWRPLQTVCWLLTFSNRQRHICSMLGILLQAGIPFFKLAV